MKYSLRSLMIVATVAIVAIAAGFLIFQAQSSRLPDFDPDIKAVGGTLKIDDKFYSGLWNCRCRVSAEEVNDLLRKLSPGKPCSEKWASEENVMATIDVDLGEGRLAPLTIYWTGHNPAVFSFGGVVYRHDIEIPASQNQDEGGRFHFELKKLCKSRKSSS